MAEHDTEVGGQHMPGPGSRRSILHEPLLQFLLIGGLLFAFSMLRSAPQDDSGYIIRVDAERIAVLAATFELDYQRQPSPAELQDLIDDYVRTEVCVREARALGLDREDQLIRDHLQSKYELLLDDGSEPPEPREAELEQFLQEQQDRYRAEDALSFRQIYLDPLQRDGEAELDASLLLEQLSGDEDLGMVQALSDPGSLPPNLPLVALSEIGWQFDPLFADALLDLPVGRWSGPVTSSYGVHLVFIEERRAGRNLSLDEVRTDVERDWVDAQLRARLDRELDRIRTRYTIEIAPVTLDIPATDVLNSTSGEAEAGQ